MKKLIPISLIAFVVNAIFSCSHKQASVTDVVVDTTSSSNYKISMYPEVEALYKFDSLHKDLVDYQVIQSAPVTVTKQIKAIAGGSIQTFYQFNFQHDTSLVVSFSIVTDSLMTKSYRHDSTFVHAYPTPTQLINFTINKISSTVYYQSDNLNVNITSQTSGRISGNYAIRLTPIFNSLNYGNRGSVSVEGTFKNIVIKY